MKKHPHLNKKLWYRKNNAVYIARSNLTWNSDILGADCFKFHPNLILTETDSNINPKGNLTIWKYNFFPEGIHISYHNKNSWKKENGFQGQEIKYFRAVGKGQEFVISENFEFIKYVKKIINNQYSKKIK